MKPLALLSAGLTLAALFAASAAVTGLTAHADEPQAGEPQYDASGRLVLERDYRDWVFLSSGIDMSYTDGPAPAGMHMFDNVFAPRAAYAAFRRTGVWPDKTVLMLESRTAATKGSINRQGQFQTAEVMGLEAHVKDEKRFKGGWGFFSFGSEGASAAQIPYAASCYACHQAHAAADTTFVQFYPTLLAVATRLKTLNPSYLAEVNQGAK